MNIIVLYSSETQNGIIYGLKSSGHTVIAFNYGLGKLNALFRLYYKLTNKQWVRIVYQFNFEIRKAYEYQKKYPQDKIIILKGHTITPETKLLLQQIQAQKIQWTIDSVTRWPGQATLFPYMDKVFFQDGSDLDLHGNSKWLPLGFDSTLFKFNDKKDIDILLLGNLQQPYYLNRKECFLKVAPLAKKGFTICFAGSNASKEVLSVFKQNGVKVLGKKRLKEYAQIISRSRICINIHQNDGCMAINPLFFAIPATGGIELTDSYKYLENWLTPNKHYFATNVNSIDKDIIPLLTLKGISKDIAMEVEMKHSYSARAKYLLQDDAE